MELTGKIFLKNVINKRFNPIYFLIQDNVQEFLETQTFYILINFSDSLILI